MNNPNVAFVDQVYKQKVQYYYNPVYSQYVAIFGDRYHVGGGPILRKDEKGNWRDLNGTLNKGIEDMMDSQIKRHEEAKKRMGK